MTSLEERDKRTPDSPWNRLDRLFDEWMRMQPMRRLLGAETPGEEIIRVDEYRDDDVQVIRAELPGIDPDKDVQLTVTNGMLRINAERRTEEQTEEKGVIRREMRYGSFTRSLPLAEGATDDDIDASYKNGVLEIRVPVAQPVARPEPKMIPVSHD
jgi:HSP20 family protein